MARSRSRSRSSPPVRRRRRRQRARSSPSRCFQISVKRFNNRSDHFFFSWAFLSTTLVCFVSIPCFSWHMTWCFAWHITRKCYSSGMYCCRHEVTSPETWAVKAGQSAGVDSHVANGEASRPATGWAATNTISQHSPNSFSVFFFDFWDFLEVSCWKKATPGPFGIPKP